MNTAIYTITREIATLLSVFSSYTLLGQGDAIRATLNLILLCFFIYTSKLHQKRVSVPSASYFFIFLIMFCVNSLSSGICNLELMRSLNRNLVAARWIEKDYYHLYFAVSTFTYIIISLHLLSIKHEFKQMACNTSIQIPSITNVYINGAILLLLLRYFSGYSEVLIPIFVYCTLNIIERKNGRTLYCVILMFLSLFFKGMIISRFKFVEIALPILFCLIILKEKSSQEKIGFIKTHIALMFIFSIIMAYGVVSEIFKLNRLNNSNEYSIFAAFSDTSQLVNWINRQISRVFIIWIKLGGYIIYHTDLYGKYFGLTYIKSIVRIFGFETVSLPKISAKYHGSNYAQPGLLAEGYANFGILGAVVNLLSVYFLITFLERRYYEKPSFERLLYMTVPFSQIFLDGGTLNSAILLILACFIFTNVKTRLKISHEHF